MKDTHAIIWSLWPTIKEMAHDLGEIASDLVRMKYRGDIPGPKHDKKILLRAVYEGATLRATDIQDYRRRDITNNFIAIRRDKIGQTYNALGGVSVVARKTGASTNILYVAKSRGRLPVKHKYELMMLAQDRGVSIDESLFNDPRGDIA